MAPVATTDNVTSNGTDIASLKEAAKVFNPFYSPSAGDDNDGNYEFAKYKPSFPDVKWEPLKEQSVTDRGLFADPEKKSLFAAATKVQHLTPAIGTEIIGIDLRQLTNQQKDELALLVAERGAVFFRDQEINIHEQLELARHFGPLHKHATTGVPREPGLEEVHAASIDFGRHIKLIFPFQYFLLQIHVQDGEQEGTKAITDPLLCQQWRQGSADPNKKAHTIQ
ncbi:predicted protein [Postia placenta Mad-698-R]|nr:predicted protein [Postia placenta Mad-698-R]